MPVLVLGSRVNVASAAYLLALAAPEIEPLQVVRELLMNSMEHGATQVRFGPDWNHVESEVKKRREPTYRLMCEDDGTGMDDIWRRSKTLVDPDPKGKKVGIQDNFRIGVRLAALPYNPAGVIFMSFPDGPDSGEMVMLKQDPKSKEYACVQWDTEKYDLVNEDNPEVAVAPPSYFPKFAKKSGTVVILLGAHEKQDTYVELGPKKLGVHDIVTYINNRFAKIPDKVQVHVYEFNNNSLDKKNYPKSFNESTLRTKKDIQGKGQYRRALGTFHFLEDLAEDYEVITVSSKDGGRARIHLFIRYEEGKEPDTVINKDPHAVVDHVNVFGFLYKNEIYHRVHPKAVYHYQKRFQVWGGPGTLSRRICMLVEPLEDTGVHNNISRTTLQYKDSKDAPLDEWAEDFATKIPAYIRKLLASVFVDADPNELLEKMLDKYFSENYQIRGDRTRGGRREGKNGHGGGGGGGGHNGTSLPRGRPDVQWSMELDKEVSAEFYAEKNMLLLNPKFPEFEELVHRMRSKFPKEPLLEKAVHMSIAAGMACCIGASRCRQRKLTSWTRQDYLASIDRPALTAASTLGGMNLELAIPEFLKQLKRAKKS